MESTSWCSYRSNCCRQKRIPDRLGDRGKELKDPMLAVTKVSTSSIANVVCDWEAVARRQYAH